MVGAAFAIGGKEIIVLSLNCRGQDVHGEVGNTVDKSSDGVSWAYPA